MSSATRTLPDFSTLYRRQGAERVPMRPVRLADAAPDLLPDGLSDEEERAARAVVAPTVRLERGHWGADPAVQAEPGHAGLLVVDGLLTRDVTLGDVTATELIGRGDLLRPADF